jgi:hypothetical protein
VAGANRYYGLEFVGQFLGLIDRFRELLGFAFDFVGHLEVNTAAS